MPLSDFTFGCHGIPERCFRFRGRYMPFCARCLGASIGHMGAAINFFIGSMLPLVYAPIGLVIMLMDWVLQNKYKLYHSNVARLVTGIMGGYAVGVILWRVVGGVWQLLLSAIRL